MISKLSWKVTGRIWRALGLSFLLSHPTRRSTQRHLYALTHVCKRKQKLSVELDKENVRENFSLNHSVLVLGPSAQPSSKEGALWLQKQLYEKSRGAMFYEMEILGCL